jgi:hypothetical protein
MEIIAGKLAIYQKCRTTESIPMVDIISASLGTLLSYLVSTVIDEPALLSGLRHILTSKII